jgi:hypothetical protein
MTPKPLQDGSKWGASRARLRSFGVVGFSPTFPARPVAEHCAPAGTARPPLSLKPFEWPAPINARFARLFSCPTCSISRSAGCRWTLKKFLHVTTIQHRRLGLFERRDDGSHPTPPTLHLRHSSLPSWFTLLRFRSISTFPGSDTPATHGFFSDI